jgi:hypothetical protein
VGILEREQLKHILGKLLERYGTERLQWRYHLWKQERMSKGNVLLLLIVLAYGETIFSSMGSWILEGTTYYIVDNKILILQQQPHRLIENRFTQPSNLQSLSLKVLLSFSINLTAA